MDQGLGIGSKFPFFNRHQLTLTRFIQLQQVEEGAGKAPPPVLVLHGHYGGCVGDLPSYDAFVLGGPYSVRGYNMGELGAARNILEVNNEAIKRKTFFLPSPNDKRLRCLICFIECSLVRRSEYL